MCQFCDSIKPEDVFCVRVEKELMILPPSGKDNFLPGLWRIIKTVGKRLEKNSSDNYALQMATASILNLVYLEREFLKEHGGENRYIKYFPKYTKNGKIKEVFFTSEFFCQKPKMERIFVCKTANGVVAVGKNICGKAWTCPVCGAKIAVRRNQEIHIILNKAYREKKSVFMVTFTAPHSAKDSILGFSKKLQLAYVHFRDSAYWKKCEKHYRCFGYIKSMETTLCGENGAHNHFHIIFIFDASFSKDYGEMILYQDIIKQWKKSCIKMGLLNPNDPKKLAEFNEHAINVKRDFDPNYIAKQSEQWQKEHGVSPEWSAAEEITLGKMKKGRSSVTPFGYVANICRRAAVDGYKNYSDLLKDCELFIEYACAMTGRAQYGFSKGLRAWAGLDEEKTDKGLVNEIRDHGELIGELDKGQYNFIRKNFLWKPIKNALFENTTKAIEIISKVFVQNGLHPFYPPIEIEDAAHSDVFPWFNELSQIPL